jgi:hypothetical protein
MEIIYTASPKEHHFYHIQILVDGEWRYAWSKNMDRAVTFTGSEGQEYSSRFADARAREGVYARVVMRTPDEPVPTKDYREPAEAEVARLDPFPYAGVGHATGERFPANDPMRVYGEFKPRKGYEQDIRKYRHRGDNVG